MVKVISEKKKKNTNCESTRKSRIYAIIHVIMFEQELEKKSSLTTSEGR